MEIKELIFLIETYGANKGRWPEEKRIKAEKLLLSSSEAQSVLSEARKLDSLLDQYVVRDVDKLLSHKIVYENIQREKSGFISYLLNPSFALVMMFVCLVLGFLTGYFDVVSLSQQVSNIDFATLLIAPFEIGVI